MASLVLTVIGDDRPGLVGALSDLVSSHGGNWEHSQMAQMAGKFAGIVLVTVGDDRADELVDALAGLGEGGLLEVRAEKASGAPAAGPVAAGGVRLHLVGSDRPGIVREISAALAERGVTIEELATSTSDAPMAGGVLFEARAVLGLPAGRELDEVRVALEAVADELMVDLDLSLPD